MSSAPKTVPFFKKGKSRPTTTRKRSASPPPSAAAAATAPSTSTSSVILPSRKAAPTLLSAGTKRTASQRESAYDDPEEPLRDDGPDVKWTAAGSHVAAALDILAGDEAEALLLSKRRRTEDGDEVEPLSADGQYRGQAAYHTHLKAKEVPKAMRVGPTRNASTIRTVTIVDYQPDVCKDYKETGYCGFGDTCKFLHDRGTYLAGWQLDKLAENAAKNPGDPESDSDSDEEDVPFACLICRKHYTDPIVTRCGHYFCSACAIKRFAKTPKCLACGAPTGGMFNRADKILEKINKKKTEKEERRKRDEGDDGEDGEGGGKVEIEGLETQGGGGEQSDDDEDEDED
ncbi:hypothetical protein FB45DRAFT_891389 [Roridomyces roridus]|uniref:Pre-mRNA-splicing factor CWC24 n=1 Tax=Roridomyces roridus TaxID=1738132 RepID=A0AAD7CEI8_9AGAR|nr:hypothetical protein FB45DRAFT_891389 [Roridomyces roridus]